MRVFIFLVVVVFTLNGCSTVSYRANSQFHAYFESSKTVAIINPDIKMYQLTAGGVEEYNADWSQNSNRIILERLQEELENLSRTKFVYLQESTLNKNDLQLLDEQKGIFFTVADSILMHTYSPETTFRHKLKKFDYTLGNEIKSLDKLISADTFLFCSAKNYIWTSGRTILATLGILTTLATGVAMVVPAGNEFIAVALVDSISGDIMWFNYIPMPGDLRDETAVDSIITRLFKDFPKELRN